MALSSPQEIQARLEAIEQDLATRQNDYEKAAESWYLAKREREHDYAMHFTAASGTVAERAAIANEKTAQIGDEWESNFEALKAVVKTLEARASILMSLLKAQR